MDSGRGVVKVGLHLASFTWPDAPVSLPVLLAQTAERAEAVGVTKLTLMDHWFQMEDLGLLAKIVATLDVLSGGRPFDDVDCFLSGAGEYSRLGIDLIELVRWGHPVEHAERVGAEIVEALDRL